MPIPFSFFFVLFWFEIKSKRKLKKERKVDKRRKEKKMEIKKEKR